MYMYDTGGKAGATCPGTSGRIDGCTGEALVIYGLYDGGREINQPIKDQDYVYFRQKSQGNYLWCPQDGSVNMCKAAASCPGSGSNRVSGGCGGEKFQIFNAVREAYE